MKELGKAETACLPVLNTVVTTILLWKKSTPTPTRTLISLIGTAAPQEDIAMIPGTGFEFFELEKKKKKKIVVTDRFAVQETYSALFCYALQVRQTTKRSSH